MAGERLTADEVEVRADRHEDFALAEDGGWAVALDLELDDDLRREGLARELVRASTTSARSWASTSPTASPSRSAPTTRSGRRSTPTATTC